jgi:hemerythrin-like metal-binding protein
MPHLSWDRRFALGLPPLDAEHRALFQDVRGVQACLEAGEGTAIVIARMEALLRRLDDHCETEEAEMARTGYPGLEVHRGSHQHLRIRLLAIREHLGTGTVEAGLDLSRLLYEWLRGHMEVEDRAFSRFLKDREPQPGARA